MNKIEVSKGLLKQMMNSMETKELTPDNKYIFMHRDDNTVYRSYITKEECDEFYRIKKTIRGGWKWISLKKEK